MASHRNTPLQTVLSLDGYKRGPFTCRYFLATSYLVYSFCGAFFLLKGQIPELMHQHPKGFSENLGYLYSADTEIIMNTELVNYESMLATKETADWTFWIMIATFGAATMSLLSVLVTLKAVLIAKKGLHTWKEQQINNAKAEWVSSLSVYASEISFLPDRIHHVSGFDRKHLDRVAALMYECIRCWKILDVHLQLSAEHSLSFNSKYLQAWRDFSSKHKSYMSGQITRDELKQEVIHLYNI